MAESPAWIGMKFWW